MVVRQQLRGPPHEALRLGKRQVQRARQHPTHIATTHNTHHTQRRRPRRTTTEGYDGSTALWAAAHPSCGDSQHTQCRRPRRTTTSDFTQDWRCTPPKDTRTTCTTGSPAGVQPLCGGHLLAERLPGGAARGAHRGRRGRPRPVPGHHPDAGRGAAQRHAQP